MDLTVAEALLDLARTINPNLPCLIVPPRGTRSVDLARAKLCLRLKADKVTALRAMVEEWDMQRLIREMY